MTRSYTSRQIADGLLAGEFTRDSAFVPLAEVERLTRERDEARAEVERLKSEPETLRAELIAICNASRAALANAYDRARGSRKALEAKP